MQIHLSFDYELFFGTSSGSIDNCILKPTQRLMDISKKYRVPFIFFVDAGYLWQLKNHSHIPQCKSDYDKIALQILELRAGGHEIGLHIHPHWEDSFFKDNSWNINTTRYKLADFTDDEIDNIITKYHQAIIDIVQTPCKSYRAGGWCIQPFGPIKKSLIKNNILVDSTIYHNGLHSSCAHSYDFTSAPTKDEWRFDNDPCIESSNGLFTEIPITTDRIPPLFYWNLYLKMKSNPSIYKPVGDGNWLVDKKRIYKHFYSGTNHFACADGFFASRLPSILTSCEKQQRKRMMVLSHPKSLAPYSFDALDAFISKAKTKGHTFSTITS
jgi:peptidoglycan/xylan/chitin deacetylase (PgdA/CDA1 family)